MKLEKSASVTFRSRRRSQYSGFHVSEIGPGATGVIITYEKGHMPDLEDSSVSFVHPGGTGIALRIKPGPDHMPARFVRYLVQHAEPYVEHLDKAERDGFAEAVTNLQSDEPGARTRGLMFLRGLCARQGASNLSLELAHWLAGDWFWGEPE